MKNNLSQFLWQVKVYKVYKYPVPKNESSLKVIESKEGIFYLEVQDT